MAAQPTEERKTTEQVTKSLHDRISKLPALSCDKCIYRVPPRIRTRKPGAFTPRIVSVGPFHYRKPEFRSGEDLKLEFLQDFLKRAHKAISFVKFVVSEEANIRGFYQGLREDDITSKDFCEMIFLDSIFIVELLLKKEKKDYIFEKQWLCQDLLHDMILVENQVPIYICSNIYNKYIVSTGNKKMFSDLVHEYIQELGNFPNLGGLWGIDPRHFVEYLWDAHKPENDEYFYEGGKFIYSVPCAVDLKINGVRFAQEDPDFSMTFISFVDGVLAIPILTVNEWTETFFHNQIAFEQCLGRQTSYVSNYVVFMNNLLRTPEDVEILISEGIIEDTMNDSENICKMFGEFYKDRPTKGTDSCLGAFCDMLNEYISTRKSQLVIG